MLAVLGLMTNFSKMEKKVEKVTLLPLDEEWAFTNAAKTTKSMRHFMAMSSIFSSRVPDEMPT